MYVYVHHVYDVYYIKYILYVHIYIYHIYISHIYIYIYIWGSISLVQGSKPGISPSASGAKNDFLLGQVSESTFGRLQDSPNGVRRAFLGVLGVFWALLGTSKTCDSVQYILQKSDCHGCSVPRRLSIAGLRRLGASGGVWGCFLEPFWVPFLAC